MDYIIDMKGGTPGVHLQQQNLENLIAETRDFAGDSMRLYVRRCGNQSISHRV